MFKMSIVSIHIMLWIVMNVGRINQNLTNLKLPGEGPLGFGRKGRIAIKQNQQTCSNPFIRAISDTLS